jgi:hypothetical protein
LQPWKKYLTYCSFFRISIEYYCFPTTSRYKTVANLIIFYLKEPFNEVNIIAVFCQMLILLLKVIVWSIWPTLFSFLSSSMLLIDIVSASAGVPNLWYAYHQWYAKGPQVVRQKFLKTDNIIWIITISKGTIYITKLSRNLAILIT